MDESRANCCLYQGQIYKEGSQVNGYVYRLVCKAGEWHEADETREESPESLEYFYH